MSCPGAGGTHHAFRGRGEGFCAFNDIAVGAAAAMAEHGVERVLVVDLDVHQARVSSFVCPAQDQRLDACLDACPAMGLARAGRSVMSFFERSAEWSAHSLAAWNLHTNPLCPADIMARNSVGCVA